MKVSKYGETVSFVRDIIVVNFTREEVEGVLTDLRHHNIPCSTCAMLPALKKKLEEML